MLLLFYITNLSKIINHHLYNHIIEKKFLNLKLILLKLIN